MRIIMTCLIVIDSKPLTQYIIVRKDLPLGTIAAQVAHAAGSSSDRHPEGTYVVVLAAESEDHLQRIGERISEAGIQNTPVFEVDPPYANSLMAIGLNLVRDRSAVRSVLSSLPLLKENS